MGSVMWTPHVLTTPRELEREVEFRCGGLTDDIESAFHPDYDLTIPWIRLGGGTGGRTTTTFAVGLASGLTTERWDVPDRHALAAFGVRLLTVRECLAGTFQRPPSRERMGRVVGAVEARGHYTSGSGVERTPDVCPMG